VCKHKINDVLNFNAFKKTFLDENDAKSSSAKVAIDISKTLRTTLLDTSTNTHEL